MRSWERKDITDILIKHHEELRASSKKLARDQQLLQGVTTTFTQASDELDDDCIVIEDFLEEDFGIYWDGLEFQRPKEPIERMKGRSLKDYANYHKKQEE